MTSRTRAAITEALRVAALFFLLRYAGGFSSVQSGVLIASIVALYVRLRSQRPTQPSFVPYQVDVLLNYWTILEDFDLGGIDTVPRATWNLWNSSLSYSVVRPGLVFNNARKTFATKVDLRVFLEPIGFTLENEVVIRHDNEDGEDGPFLPPGLRLTGDSHIALSIDLPLAHWKKVERKEEFQGAHTSHDPRTGLISIELAVIPPEEFEVVASWRALTDDAEERRHDAVIRRVAARARFGWKGVARDASEFDNATTADESSTILNKYATVCHDEI